MINLLPPELKGDYQYARRNRKLLRWVIGFVFGIAGIVLITGVGAFVMRNKASDFQSTTAATQLQLSSEHIDAIQKQESTISGNLSLMVTVLSKEVLFSKLLTKLGSVTPPNVILTGIAISQTEQAIDITAQAGSYTAATQLQVNLSDPNNQIFSKADIVNIACVDPAKATNPSYPCNAAIRALFTSNNPFLFINSSKKGSS